MVQEILRLCVRCDAHAPASVREAISKLPEVGWIFGDAMLVASELVTNAVRDCQSTEADLMTVQITADGPLQIQVRAPRHSTGGAPVVERPTELGGIGLKIVKALSTDWGAERDADGYTLWAELPRPN